MMKKAKKQLCLSCRRECKQPEFAAVIQCKNYYPMPIINYKEGKQLDFEFKKI